MRRGGMPEGEARMILNVTPKATDAEVVEVRACSPAHAYPHARPAPLPRAGFDSDSLHCSRSQAHERLVAMNDPDKGGSAYLQQKIGNARDALIAPPAEEAPPKKES